ncbi:MAG: nucleotidyl transferase AbiEii/AbiGii toxin family protein [Candidatus Moranbacteria bacterium]|nr:nucleotidyl transferase AbiEii/AbiGii toxin family protein [Candidatus Moranbacteria bacterium]
MLDKFFLEDYIKRNNIPNVPRRILTEYLQAEILDILYASKFASYLSFLGGTCLRFVYKIGRFSEDLDFDLIKSGLDYKELATYIGKRLRELGFNAETKTKETENIFIISIKFSEVMEEMGIGAMENQKLTVKFEIDPKPFKSIRFESRQISTYGKSFNVVANTLETIFAQKIIALKSRPYQKGRDFFDLIWFLAQKNIEPNYALLKEKGIKVKNREDLKKELKNIIAASDLKQAARDVERFLFHPEKAKWIGDLGSYIDQF